MDTPKKKANENSLSPILSSVPSQPNIYDEQDEPDIEDIDTDDEDYPPQTFGLLVSSIENLPPSRTPSPKVSASQSKDRSPISQMESQGFDKSPISQLESQVDRISPNNNSLTIEDDSEIICDLSTEFSLEIDLDDEDEEDNSPLPPEQDYTEISNKLSADKDHEMEDPVEEQEQEEPDKIMEEGEEGEEDEDEEEEEEETILPNYRSWVNTLIKLK